MMAAWLRRLSRIAVYILVAPLVGEGLRVPVVTDGLDHTNDTEYTAGADNLFSPTYEAEGNIDGSTEASSANTVGSSLVLHANRSSIKGDGLWIRSGLPKATRAVASYAPAMCEEVRALLGAHTQVSMFKGFMDMLCSDEYQCDEVFPDVRSGCLYVSTDAHVQGLLGALGRPHPCKFAQVLINSYFTGEDCPTEQPFDSVKSLGGVAYATCAGGFQTHAGRCIEASLVGVTRDSSVRVFTLEGHIGMPTTWHKQLESGHHDNHAMPARLMGRKGVVPTHTEIQLNITVCEPSSGAIKVGDEQLDLQAQALDRGFSGLAHCREPTAYPVEAADLNLSFRVVKPFRRIVDDRCEVCDMYYKVLWAELTSQVPGQIQVLVCQTDSLVGFSARPEADHRSIMIDHRTLPGGQYYNMNYGGTLVHEMGHYLGLLHTFSHGCSGDGDMVADTNPEAYPWFGCPGVLHPPRHSCRGLDPIHNFMDYADDRCMCAFTPLQKERVWDMLAEFMEDLIPGAPRLARDTAEAAQ